MERKWLLFAFMLTGLAPASAQQATGGVEQAGGGPTAAETHVLAVDGIGTGNLELDGPGVETWSFTGEAGQTVTVTVRTKIFAPAVQLVSPGGEELARDDHGGFRRNFDAQVVARLPLDGRYLVRVATNGGRASGGVYVVAVRSGTVRSMVLNTRAGGRYEDPLRADVWSFDAMAGQVVSVGVYSDGVWPDAFSPVVQLRSPGGRPLARDEDILRFSDADREARLVAFLPDDGRYFVEVTDARAFRTGTYRMTAHAPTVTPRGRRPGAGDATGARRTGRPGRR